MLLFEKFESARSLWYAKLPANPRSLGGRLEVDQVGNVHSSAFYDQALVSATAGAMTIFLHICKDYTRADGATLPLQSARFFCRMFELNVIDICRQCSILVSRTEWFFTEEFMTCCDSSTTLTSGMNQEGLRDAFDSICVCVASDTRQLNESQLP